MGSLVFVHAVRGAVWISVWSDVCGCALSGLCGAPVLFLNSVRCLVQGRLAELCLLCLWAWTRMDHTLDPSRPLGRICSRAGHETLAVAPAALGFIAIAKRSVVRVPVGRSGRRRRRGWQGQGWTAAVGRRGQPRATPGARRRRGSVRRVAIEAGGGHAPFCLLRFVDACFGASGARRTGLASRERRTGLASREARSEACGRVMSAAVGAGFLADRGPRAH
jgi:hypothetical protein